MKLFTVKRTDSDEIEWEGIEASSGLVAMLPIRPDVGLPTVFVSFDKLIESFQDVPHAYVAWTEIAVDPQ